VRNFDVRLFQLLNINIYNVFILRDKLDKLLGVYFMEHLQEENIPYIDCIVDDFKVINNKLEINLDIVKR
jgi:hypothetical protein